MWIVSSGWDEGWKVKPLAKVIRREAGGDILMSSSTAVTVVDSMSFIMSDLDNGAIFLCRNMVRFSTRSLIMKISEELWGEKCKCKCNVMTEIRYHERAFWGKRTRSPSYH